MDETKITRRSERTELRAKALDSSKSRLESCSAGIRPALDSRFHSKRGKPSRIKLWRQNGNSIRRKSFDLDAGELRLFDQSRDLSVGFPERNPPRGELVGHFCRQDMAP